MREPNLLWVHTGYSMEPNPTSSCSQYFMDPKVQFLVHNILPQVLNWNQMIPVHARQSYSFLSSILLLSLHLRQDLPIALFLRDYLPKRCMQVSSSRATCPAYLTLHDLVSRDTNSEAPIIAFYHLLVTPSIFCQNILLSTQFSHTISLYD